MSEAERPEHSEGGKYVVEGQEFVRDQRYITTRITPGGGSATGDLDPASDTFPVEAGRYRLVAARACPWANRAIIVRRLLGLEDAISLGLPGPTHDEQSWTFDLDPDGLDPVLGIHRLQDAYFARQPGYPRGITVPALVDTRTGAVVTNDFAQMTLDLSTQWSDHHRPGAPALLPADLDQRADMDALMRWVFTEVNNGVYRCGFSGSQKAYEAAYARLFSGLDRLEDRLETRRFLMGASITEADVRLFTTLVRFDAVYYSHFKTNRSLLTAMPNLWAYARDLFQLPGFGDTVDFQQIKDHYYVVQRDINPTGIVPVGPDLSGWVTEHGRAGRVGDLWGDRPWGDGTAPGPVREGEQVDPAHTPLRH
jgi:putative glutathione S-transferase